MPSYDLLCMTNEGGEEQKVEAKSEDENGDKN